VRSELTATTLTAPYYPEGVDAGVLKHINEAGVILAGGLYPGIKTRYFRVGHMGAVTPSDILTTIGAIEQGLVRAGYQLEMGTGLAAAQRALL
jgi:alanine-glyoxylate transaminase/serine-glyoxylate transaminase/serine-pyruvate transaminase